MSFSPLMLELILHYHSSCQDDPWINSGAAIVPEIMSDLVRLGLLTHEPNGKSVAEGAPKQLYLPTDKLHHFVSMLCDTPLPVERWLDPRTKEIVVFP